MSRLPCGITFPSFTQAYAVIQGNLIVSTENGNDQIETPGLHVGQAGMFFSGNGDDHIELGASGSYSVSPTFGRLAIKTYAGADTIEINSVSVAGSTLIDSGQNADEITIRTGSFQGSTRIDSGNGNDRVQVGDNFSRELAVMSFEPLEVADAITTTDALTPGVDRVFIKMASDLFISTGEGQDSIQLFSAEIDGDVAIYSGNGDDSLIVGGSFEGYGIISPTFKDQLWIGGRLTIKTYAGTDKISSENFQVRGHTLIDSGVGDDTVRLGGENGRQNIFYDSFELHTSGGDDQIEIVKVNFISGTAGFWLGTGEDNFLMSETKFHSWASLFTEGGQDLIEVEYSSSGAAFRLFANSDRPIFRGNAPHFWNILIGDWVGPVTLGPILN